MPERLTHLDLDQRAGVWKQAQREACSRDGDDHDLGSIPWPGAGRGHWESSCRRMVCQERRRQRQRLFSGLGGEKEVGGDKQ